MQMKTYYHVSFDKITYILYWGTMHQKYAKWHNKASAEQMFIISRDHIQLCPLAMLNINNTVCVRGVYSKLFRLILHIYANIICK